MDPAEEFRLEVSRNIEGLIADRELQEFSLQWLQKTLKHRYSYNFSWLSRPIIQYPQDIVALQELLWQVDPDLVVETGIAHGGSLVLSASILALLEYRDAVREGRALDPQRPKRRVVGVDVDIRQHNRAAIEAHPMASRIEMIVGSSTAADVVSAIAQRARSARRVLVLLDSNHTHQHVLDELEAYAPMTSVDSYCVVYDSIIDDLPDDSFRDRPWGRGNNPKTAIVEYLRRLEIEGRAALDGRPLALEIDRKLDKRLLITVAPDGYLRRRA